MFLYEFIKKIVNYIPPIRKVVQERNEYAEYSERLLVKVNQLTSDKKELITSKEQLELEIEEGIKLNNRLSLEKEKLLEVKKKLFQEKEELEESNKQLELENLRLQKINNQLEVNKQELEEINKNLELSKQEVEKDNKQLVLDKENLIDLNEKSKEKQASLEEKINELEADSLKIANFNSEQFWEQHYSDGGNSGTGSYGRLAQFKAGVVNDFVKSKGVVDVIEFGCGDGNQLTLSEYPNYVGVDVSKTIVDKNREKFASDEKKIFFSTEEREKYMNRKYDLALSMDVIFHLLEDSTYYKYMDDLFMSSCRYIIIYSSNHEEYTRWAEYRHRNFMKYVQERFREWKLIEFIPNKYPYIIGGESETSSADFYIFSKL